MIAAPGRARNFLVGGRWDARNDLRLVLMHAAILQGLVERGRAVEEAEDLEAPLQVIVGVCDIAHGARRLTALLSSL